MSPSERLKENAARYAAQRGLRLDRQLGFGKDGSVFSEGNGKNESCKCLTRRVGSLFPSIAWPIHKKTRGLPAAATKDGRE
jgi:hypothetical protein